MSSLGSPSNPLRVAIVGSGPSGFYAAEHLQKQDIAVQIDMIERLPTPFGLVRGGVAPDHDKIKSVTKVYERIAQKPDFGFYGNVNFGKDVTLAELEARYHAIIYAVGAQTDRNLDIPGEDLSGSHAATEFVGWYNAHPDYRNYEFDLTQESAVVIGVGNVAMDVTSILARTYAELAQTDIADYALEALANSNIKTIYILGRRGHPQAAFTNPEIKELGEMPGADLIITPEEVTLGDLSREELLENPDRTAEKNLQTMTLYSERAPEGKPRQIILRFLTSPVEILGDDRVTAIKVVKNELYRDERGKIRPRATDQTEVIPVGLVFRSVGYHGIPLPDLPFNESWGTIPNAQGRVLLQQDSDEKLTGNYVVGWIKRGPSGVIGTNKPDSVETVNALLEDMEKDALLSPSLTTPDSLEKLLHERGVQIVTYADWQTLDSIEQSRGEAQGRPRVKFSKIEDMLNAIAEHKQTDPMGD
jgi:ferredoxin--NADP+ reductase